jgi:peptidylprolyl isomerase
LSHLAFGSCGWHISLSGKPVRRPRPRKSRFSKIVVGAVIIALVAVAIIVVIILGPVGGPTYSDVSFSSVTPGTPCRFSVLWRDGANFSGYVFGSNNTGTFVNDTWVPFQSFFNSTFAFSNVTKTLTGLAGDTVQWRVWCNDSNNRWNSVSLQTLVVGTRVFLETSMGNVTIQLYDDMPITAGNFLNLTKRGVYDGTIFHRIAWYNDSTPFVIQGGDPTGTGKGDPSIPAIPDEFTGHNFNRRGTVAMANSGPNTGSSQFFVNLVDSDQLDTSYPVFGVVTDGMSVVDAISHVPRDSNDRPLQPYPTVIKAIIIG